MLLKSVSTPLLDVAYIESGHSDGLAVGLTSGPTVLLVHGWPDDALTWNAVAAMLNAQGLRTLAPYLRGCGPTRFLDPSTPRSGQIAALGQDLADFIQALDLRDVILVGHDWGARAAYVAAALVPERLRGMVTLSVGYNTSRPDQRLSFDQARQYWYHWYFALERGREALAADKADFVRRMWRLWSPSWPFSQDDLEKTLASFDNPDWVDITIHSYRHRWGNAAGSPAYAALEAFLADTPQIRVPTRMLHGAEDGATLPETSAGKECFFESGYERGVLPTSGHFIQREQPAAVVDAILDVIAATI